jgi:hypothetical protein
VTSTLYGPSFFAGRTHTVVLSASVVVPALVSYLGCRSMVDLGSGQGEWVEAFAALGVDATGVDIAAPEPENRHDLTVPLNLGRRFDLALSLEVGEHLPEPAADTLVDSAVTHADVVVFSAATVGQEGIGHINCQPHEYWHEKFAARGYVMSDPFRPVLAGDDRVSPWYRDNLFMYERAS